MTNDELIKKKSLLESLERSESEARRIDQYLSNSTAGLPRRSLDPAPQRRENAQEDTASIDSDFPPTHGDHTNPPSAAQGAPQPDGSSPAHRKNSSGNFITNKIFGRISHAVHGVVDVDPERTRRDLIGKTRESIGQLEQAKLASEQDVREASSGILKDLKRFQAEKEDDLRRYMVSTLDS
jgi:hypothetical protein